MLLPLPLIHARLEELDPNTFETRAAELLHGLGFSRIMMARKTKDMSGAWTVVGVGGKGQGLAQDPGHERWVNGRV